MIKKILSGIFHRIIGFPQTIKDRVKKSTWYHNRFPHLSEYERLKQGADIICIGSTPAKNAIDFKVQREIQGYNLAVCPETIFYDFQVLKNYHSYLKQGGRVIFVLCPFTFLKDYYRNEYGSTSYLNERYYPILHRAMIDSFDYKIYHKYVENPLLLGPKAWVSVFYNVPTIKSSSTLQNPDTPEISKSLCRNRVQLWKREFRLTELKPDQIPDEIENAIKDNIIIFKKMKEFCEERGYNATIVIPPFSEEMTSLLPNEFVEHTLFEPVRQTGIPYITYYGKTEWLSRNLYYHGFLLNANGRKKLTVDIIKKLYS